MFQNYLFQLSDKCYWYFDRDCIESVDCLAQCGHFNINPSNPRTWSILLFVSFSSFYIFYQNVFHFYFPSRSLKMLCLSLCVCLCVLSIVRLFVTPWTIACLFCPWDFQARILEWVATSFSKASSQPRDKTCISCISCFGRQILY